MLGRVEGKWSYRRVSSLGSIHQVLRMATRDPGNMIAQLKSRDCLNVLPRVGCVSSLLTATVNFNNSNICDNMQGP